MVADARKGGEAKPTATKVWDILPSLSGTPDPERRRRLLLVLHAYIDDSGDQTKPPVFVLAGYTVNAAAGHICTGDPEASALRDYDRVAERLIPIAGDGDRHGPRASFAPDSPV